ncbi:hypothetical protein [Salinigranum salinum]|uniref:hypothetical protein n=1 Tax=Salinigranum salinum TaxID=1364937 RepID=UPI001261371F|nr:hypothetical protein [Salinigranum salinum]
MRVPDVDTSYGPPLRLPLAHAVLGLGFLLVGVVLGTVVLVGDLDGLVRLAPIHLLVLGWICLTIMGAMEQFVPVWSGVDLHSRRLADLALVLVTAGVVGLTSAAVFGRPRLFVLGLFAVAGVWTFVYDLLRTLPRPRRGDVTERHFVYALCALAVAVALGGLLAVDFSVGLLARAGLSHAAVRSGHATLALLGGVLLTVVGALYQLGPMFAGADVDRRSIRLSRVEEATLPPGVALLAAGRALAHHRLALLGAALVLVGVVAAGLLLVRVVFERRVETTPTATRYAVVAVALPLWAVLAAPTLLTHPLDTGAVGPAAAAWVLGVVFAAVLVGTLYHVVPFLIWDRRYADRVGFEPVPMPDDLYEARAARADLVGLVFGGAALVAGTVFGTPRLVVAGVAVAGTALVLAALNLVQVVWVHALRGWRAAPRERPPTGE